KRERWNGVNIIRISSIAIGKNSRWRRLVNFLSFLGACAFRLAFHSRYDVVVTLTSPPLISWLASVLVRIKGGRLVLWIMDLHPDAAIAAGLLRPNSVTAKALSVLSLNTMRSADKVIVLDRFMKVHVEAQGISPEKVVVVPLYRLATIDFDRQGRQEFRRRHGLTDKFVVMYAGNHSPCHPLGELLESMKILKARDDIAFCYVGGGTELPKVRDFAIANEINNIRFIPYLSPERGLAGVLSAADLHVLITGNNFVGIGHTAKIYNILGVLSPFLHIGPPESHISDIIARLNGNGLAIQARHGDPEVIARLICDSVQSLGTKRACRLPNDLAREFAEPVVLKRFIDQLESVCSEKLPLLKLS